MNMWNLKYVDEEGLEISLLTKCKDLNSATTLAKAIGQRENLKLLGIYQVWTDREYKEDRQQSKGD